MNLYKKECVWLYLWKQKMYTGLVFHKHQTPPELYEIKEILQILDDQPIVIPTS